MPRSRPRLCVPLVAAALAAAPTALAQEPPPPEPPQAQPPEPQAPSEPPQAQPQEPQAPSETLVTEPAPPPEPQPQPEAQPQAPPQPNTCCRFSLRFNPFQIIFRRIALEAEVKIAGPFTLGAEPAWIFAGGTDHLDEKGFGFLGYFGWTFSGRTLRGFWLRAVAGFDAFEATLTHSKFESVQTKKTIATGIFGVMIGDSVVFGQNGGFTLSGGLGVGVATADKTSLTARSPDPNIPDDRATYYDDASRIKLLGSLGVGITY